jgi:hypothetical protein
MISRQLDITLHTISVFTKRGAVEKRPAAIAYHQPKSSEIIYIDVSSFRPDPTTVLRPDVTYTATGDFQLEDVRSQGPQTENPTIGIRAGSNTGADFRFAENPTIEVLRYIRLKDGTKFARIR